MPILILIGNYSTHPLPDVYFSERSPSSACSLYSSRVGSLQIFHYFASINVFTEDSKIAARQSTAKKKVKNKTYSQKNSIRISLFRAVNVPLTRPLIFDTRSQNRTGYRHIIPFIYEPSITCTGCTGLSCVVLICSCRKSSV